jgi:hypothetical protein
LGQSTSQEVLSDDFQYLIGLGLIRKDKGNYRVANPIYKEVILRALTHDQQHQITHETEWYVQSDGLFDMAKLMTKWQEFWREDGHLAAEGFGYREAGPHLMLMAFLQRIINGGGRIDREYALGKRALDLLITWKTQRIAVEVKLYRDTETLDRALEQTANYLDSLHLNEGWLVMFDMRKTRSWKQKLVQKTKRYQGKVIHWIGC